MVFFDRLDIKSSSRLKGCPFSIPLRDLTALTGPNGSGKTTVIKSMLDGGSGDLSSTKAVLHQISDHPVQAYHLSMTELAGRPMHQSINEYGSSFLAAHDMYTLWMSAGERQISQIGDIADVTGSVILIDEMDASLDWNQQQVFAERVMRLAKDNQVIVATHSVIACLLFKEVFDMTTRTWKSARSLLPVRLLTT